MRIQEKQKVYSVDAWSPSLLSVGIIYLLHICRDKYKNNFESEICQLYLSCTHSKEKDFCHVKIKIFILLRDKNSIKYCYLCGPHCYKISFDKKLSCVMGLLFSTMDQHRSRRTI